MEWLEPVAIEVPDALRAPVGGHPLVAERLARLGLVDPDTAAAFLDPNLFQPASAFELPDMDVAVARIKAALRTGEPILIWGDFDVDGQAATALLFSALKARGANVRFHIPIRKGEGHGMRLPKLRELLAHGFRLVITCDTGIVAHDAIGYAQREGADVIVTDHHQLPATLPPAHAVIHPHRLPHGHKLRELPGVGVAYELMRALNDSIECTDLLDLVALGIVGDSAMLQGQTRYLLQRGLAMMRVSPRPAWVELCARAEINPLEINERDLAFSLVPRLNAQGRLADAADAVELLTTTDRARAQQLSFQLEALNAQRKLETRHVAASASSLIERDDSLLEYAALVLAHPDWDNGVIGIVAQQLAEKYQRPVVMLCEKDELAFGSARSIASCNITDALAACQSQLLKFGGHAMAAGLTLKRADVYAFRRELSATVRTMLTAPISEATLTVDATVTLDQLTHELYEDLQRLAPFGNGNPPFVLAAREVQTARQKKLGREGQHLRLTITDASGIQQSLFCWNTDAEKAPQGSFDAAFRFVLSRYKQQEQLALELIDWQAREDATRAANVAKAAFEIEDYRQCFDAHAKLNELIGSTGSVSDLSTAQSTLVWREADAAIAGLTRNELERADTLIVWTAPPGLAEWQAALDKVLPHRLILFGNLPTSYTVKSWLQKLAGLAKYAIKQKGGQTTLAVLAAATAQRETAVRYGLLWLQEAGKLGLMLKIDGTVQLNETANPNHVYELSTLEKLIESALAETEAYRKNWLCNERLADTAKQ